MPTLKAIRCSSLKSGRHDTKCLEEKKKKGLEKGEPLQPPRKEKEGGRKKKKERGKKAENDESMKEEKIAK